MEGGVGIRADQDSTECFNGIIPNSQVFDVVIDPNTDFKVSEESHQPSSPQLSFNVKSDTHLRHHTHKEAHLGEPLLEQQELGSSADDNFDDISSTSCSTPTHFMLNSIIDSHVRSSNVSLASGGSGGGSGAGCGSSPHHRLAVAEVHRFGYRPSCAASPHDLASCPGAAASPNLQQITHSNPRHTGEGLNGCDALKALTQASSTLALTETLIGPLKIPPISQEVLDKVVCNMENKPLLSVSAAGTDSTTSVANRQCMNTLLPSGEGTTPTALRKYASPCLTNDLQDKAVVSGKLLTSLPSILQPEIHRYPVDVSATMPSDFGRQIDHSNYVSISVGDVNRRSQTPQLVDIMPSLPSSKVEGSRRIITVPLGMSNNGPMEVYKEVHQYPTEAITTVVEKRSYLNPPPDTKQPLSSTPKLQKNSRKGRKTKNQYMSHSSLASESSTGASVGSCHTLVSQNSSELTPMTRTPTSLSKMSLDETKSDSAGPISRPMMSAAIMQMRQALEAVSNTSDNHSDKSSGGLENTSTFSDTSSNLSTLSDLSGYEDEYIKIKRLVSDAVIPPEDYKKMMSKVSSKPIETKPIPTVDYEKIIRDLQAQKEDLEIQLHRLSIQVQNAVREKELYQQQLEVTHTKITETNQKQYFEVLKQRANLEGQLEMLKQELEHSVYEKTQLQTKLSEANKEMERCVSSSAASKETEALLSARLEKYEEANKDLEERLKTREEESLKLKKDNENMKRMHEEQTRKSEEQEWSVEQLKESETKLLTEMKSLKAHMLQLQEECHNTAEIKACAELAANKASSDLTALQNSNEWYQEQLQTAQAARSKLQQDLLGVRSSLAGVTSEKETLETKVQSLIWEAEDGKARAVREKASLVAHLEALQADMTEREAVLSQLERDRGSDAKMMEDRRQRLEQDRQRIHKLRLDLSDAERQLEFVKEDLKHKCTLIGKYENELKELRTSVAVSQEVLSERESRIENLEKAVSELSVSEKKNLENGKLKDSEITLLKEKNLKLEISLTAANNEKKEVDEAITKVREDMTKLSSSFYRMKHDLAAKDRHVEMLEKEVQSNKQTEQLLQNKLEALEKKFREDTEKKKLNEEIETLKREAKDSVNSKDKLEGELTEIKKTFKTLEIEKRGLSEAVRLREEQIQNMQGSLESYREALLKKDEELYVTHEHNSALEKTYAELHRTWEVLKEDNMSLQQEAEAYTEHEKLQRREMSDLKESIQKERRLKQNLEKNVENLVKVHTEEKTQIVEETENMKKQLSHIEKDLQDVKDENSRNLEDQRKLEGKYNETVKELEEVNEENKRLEVQLKDASSESDFWKLNSTKNAETLKSLESRIEIISKDENELQDQLISVQTVSEKNISELQNLLAEKSKEVANLKDLYSKSESSISHMTQEKKKLSDQIGMLTAENTRLKKPTSVDDTLTKENKKVGENKIVSDKKSGKSNAALQKELTVLQAKLSEAEEKLKEVTKQKESLQATAKSSKKDYLLMKAKTKEFESLKVKWKQMEASGVSVEVCESLKNKNQELEQISEWKEKELSDLKASLMEKSTRALALEEREKEYCTQIEALRVQKNEFQEKLSESEEIHQKMQNDLSHYQSQLKMVENEKDEWMAKYESLRDIIPERDTSTQPAVQLGSGANVQDRALFTSNSHDSAINLTGNSTLSSLGYLNDTSQMPAINGAHYSKPVTGLQTLSSEVLDNREPQIIDLMNQITELNHGRMDALASTNNHEDAFSNSTEKGHELIYQKQIQELLDRLQQLQVSASYNHDSQRLPDAEVGSLLEKVKNLESVLESKESELEESQTKLSLSTNEFQQKRRRYESNVRLLTRKVKEHIKGRKSAEKEMQTQAEEHQRLMNEEHRRYSLLRSRCLELEGQHEAATGHVKSLETEVEEVRVALEHARKEASDHHRSALELQREVGRLKELSKLADTLRQEVGKLETSCKEKEKDVTRLTQELHTTQEELKLAEANTASINASLQKEKSSFESLQHQYDNAQASIADLQQQVKMKEERSLSSQQQQNQLEKVNIELRSSLSSAENKASALSTEAVRLREASQHIADQHKKAELQLHESNARVTAHESQIKVLEGQLRVSEEEMHQLREYQRTKEATHQATVSQLEESVARARQEILAVSTQLSQVQRERLSYQTQATELRTALHSALEQLKMKAAEEEEKKAAAAHQKSDVESIPSPAPLDLDSLTKLMERSARPLRPAPPLTSLESCLSSLKAEVAMLQTQLKKKADELVVERSDVEALDVLRNQTPDSVDISSGSQDNSNVQII